MRMPFISSTMSSTFAFPKSIFITMIYKLSPHFSNTAMKVCFLQKKKYSALNLRPLVQINYKHLSKYQAWFNVKSAANADFAPQLSLIVLADCFKR